MSWQDDQLKLKGAGFSDQEISEERDRQGRSLLQGGFTQKEVDQHFGVKEMDTSLIKSHITENLKKLDVPKTMGNSEDNSVQNLNIPAPQAAQAPTDHEGKATKKADGFIDAVEAGLQMSVAGLMTHGRPTTLMPEDAGMFMNIGFQLGELVPDLPVMGLGATIGSIMGGGIGTAVAPGPGTAAGIVMGGGAGAFALPTAMRSVIMQHYEKGDVKDFQDFWERTSAVMIESAKSATVGGLTAGVGGFVSKAAQGLAAPLARTAATTASEIATMVTVGKGLEGEVPQPQDFIEAALLVGGLHSVGPVSSKLREVWSKSGLKPSEISEHSDKNPTIKQDLLSNNNPTPQALEGFMDPKAPTVVDGQIIPADRIIKTEVEQNISPELTSEFSQENLKVVSVEPEPIKLRDEDVPTGDELQVSPEVKALRNIQNNLASKTETSSWSRMKDALVYNFKNMYTDYIDKFNPIEQAVEMLAKGEKLSTAADAYKLARMANDAKSKARYALEYGTIDYHTLKKTGAGLKEILSPVKGELPDFDAYLAARRTIELSNRGMKSPGFDVNDAKLVVEHYGPKFEKTAKQVTEYRNSMTKYLRDAGIISKESYDAILSANEFYVPFKRLNDAGEVVGGKKSKNPIKKISGVEEGTKTFSPLESIFEDTGFFMELAEVNRAKSALVDLAMKDKDQTLISLVPKEMAPVKAKSSELIKLLKEHGIEMDAVETVGFAAKTKPLKENQFEVFENGQRNIYETADPMLAKAVNAMNGEPIASNILFRLARGTSSALRLSLSLSPDFIARNIFRDQLTAGVFSKNGYSPIDMLGAIGELMNKEHSQVYQEWLKSGGAGGSFLELDKDYLQKNIFQLSKETGLMDKTWNVVSSPIHFLKVAGELAEQSTRLAEFHKTTQGDYSAGKLMEGGFNAREITVDFQRMGAKTAMLNSITAFQNVAMQGLDRTVRAVKENPQGVVGKAALMITVPSILNWYINHDDPRYKDIPGWQKDLFWVIPTDDWQKPHPSDDISRLPSYLIRYDRNGVPEVNRGTIYRFPKPQELGIIFGSLPERILEKFFGDNPDAMKGMMKTITETLTPAVIPNIASPVIETWANKSFFTGNPIVPASAEGLLPEYRYNDYTSETAKKLSSIIATVPGAKNLDLIAPAVIENWVTAWSGNMGKYALQTADLALEKAGVVPDTKPESTLSDIPFIKAFVVRHPSSGTQGIQDFYETYGRYKAASDSISRLKNRGDMDAAQKELAILSQEPNVQQVLNTGEALSNMRSTLHKIYRNPEIKPHEKRQQIDGLYYMMNQSAKSTVTQTNKLKNLGKNPQ